MDELKKEAFEEDDENQYITLTDDDGNDIAFEIIDDFEYHSRRYVVLVPYEETEDEVVILEALPTEKEDEFEFVSIEDDTLIYEIFEEFKRRNADNFDFAD